VKIFIVIGHYKMTRHKTPIHEVAYPCFIFAFLTGNVTNAVSSSAIRRTTIVRHRSLILLVFANGVAEDEQTI
jgi:hypothetical protein